MKNNTLLKTAGYINLFFLLFHLPFYWMFGWAHSLSCLNDDNRNILLTFNIIGNALLLYFTFILLHHTKIILTNALGKFFLLLVAAFYVIRIFAEFYFWTFRGFQSTIIVVLCIIPVICCLLPLIRKEESVYA
jgi:hypothetical protein